MPKYMLTASVTVGAITFVEAETREMARKIADERYVELACYGADVNESWIIEEADGEPQDIRVELA